MTASYSATDRKPRRWRWFLWLAGIILLIVFLPQVMLVQWGPALLGTLLSKQLHTLVTVEGIAGGWLSGLEIRRFEIAEGAEPEAPLMLRIERLTLNLAAGFLLVTSNPIALRIEGLELHPRQRDDGAWNLTALMATLKREGDASAQTSTSLPFLDRRLEVALVGGRLHVEEDGAIYGFEGNASSLSLAKAPLQWQFALSGVAGAALTTFGHVENLTVPASLQGNAEIRVTHLGFDTIAFLLPLAPAWQPGGRIENAQVRLALSPEQGYDLQVSLDLRQLHVSRRADTSQPAIERLQVRLQGRWQGNRWWCDTLAITGPGGHFTLQDRAWVHRDADAWRGHAAFALDIEDMQPFTRAFAPLLPPALHLQGRLQIAGAAEGTIGRDPQQALDARLLGLKANLEASLDGASWAKERATNLTTSVRLQDGILSIPKAQGNVLGGNVSLQGELPLSANAQGGSMTWQMRDLPLHTVLGKPLTRFVIARANGRITRHGNQYHLESVVHMPEFRLDPAQISAREFRLTQAVFACTTTTSLPLRQLTFTGCTITSPEMRLALNDGTVDLATDPQLAMQVKGELRGEFVNGLVPEVFVKFPDALAVQGPFSIRLQGNVWVGMQWRLAVATDRFIFEDMTFTKLRTQVVKTIGRLDIQSLKTVRGSGRVEGAGSWRLSQPAEGGLQLQAHWVPLAHPLVRDPSHGDYVVEGQVDGPFTLHTGKAGWQLTLDQQIGSVRLRHGSVTLANLPKARVRGPFGRDRDGLLWTRQLDIVSDALTVTLRHGRLPSGVSDQRDFEVDGTVSAKAEWVNAMLTVFGVKGFEVTGRTHGTLRARGKLKDVLTTLKGDGTLQVDGLSISRQDFRAVDLTVALTPGRLQITKGALGYRNGSATFQGSLGLPARLGAPGDQVVVTLRRMPFDFTQQVTNFRQQGPATLDTHALLDGRMALRTSSTGQISGEIDVQLGNATRQVRQDTRVLATVDLPDLQIISKVSSSQPQQHWQAATLRVQGNDVNVELQHLKARWTPSHLDIASAVNLNISGMVSQALTMGLLPANIELKDTVELSGTAGVRIPLRGPIEPRHVSYAGEVRLENLVVNNTKGESLSARLNLDQGRLQIDAGRVNLLGGEVRIGSPSFLGLQGPVHDFKVHVLAKQLQLQVYEGRQLALSRVLFLLAPLFIVESSRDQPRDMSGLFRGEIELAGSFHDEPGWSRSVNGGGSFRIERGRVRGSTLVSSLLIKSTLLPWNTIHNSLTGLFSKNGKAASELASLGRKAFIFGTIESPIQVQAGEVRLHKDFTVTSPELSMVINGHSTLEGELDYLVDTDLIYRMRLGAVTSLPNKIPLLGRLIRHVNPFTLLKGVELTATVKGNAFHTNDQGTLAVRVEPSLIRTQKKAPSKKGQR